MKRKIIVFTAILILAGSISAFAADTPFNRAASFLSCFDHAYARPGNKQGFWNAAADSSPPPSSSYARS